MPKIKVKSLSEAQSNYAQSGSIAATRYKQGVANADWKSAAESEQAEQNYAEGVQEAIAKKRRQKMIQNVSNAEWQERAKNKGGNAIGSAIQQSGQKWAKGFAPYREVLEGMDLPAKTRDANTNIDNRLKPIVNKMVEKKKEIKG